METTAAATPQQNDSANSVLRKRKNLADLGALGEMQPPQAEPNVSSAVPLKDDSKEKKLSSASAQTGLLTKLKNALPFNNYSRAIVLLLTIAAFASRFYKISVGNFVLWDEAHFGKFGSQYLQRTFYFDVHPPLGKMLVGLGGYLSGYDGSYDFASGSTYPDSVNYVYMRMFIATFGALVVPLSYITASELGLSQPAALLVAGMTLFEVGLIGISRLILLDALLLCFTIASTLAYARFRNQQDRPFSKLWWKSLIGTGICIGCVSSIKWVGFFVTALIGLMTVEELWTMLGDVKMPKTKFTGHFAARAFGLIVVPICIYISSFYIHFSILNRSGTGDANMSSLFQAGLIGSDLQKSPLNIAYGSKVTLKSNTRGGGLLHSHIQTFPGGSKQQQVTTYHHKDANNEFIVERPFGVKQASEDDEPVFLKSGDTIRLLHAQTGRHLHSHTIEAPLTKKDYEVSCYGNQDIADPNDLWRIEIVKDSNPSTDGVIRSLSTKFRLRHLTAACYLKSSNNLLPAWGFKQGEVSCDRSDNVKNADLMWNIEAHVNPKLPPGDGTMYKSNFWEDLWECNVGMYITNNALVPDAELEPSPLTSTPKDWWFMTRGIRMSSWDDAVTKFYMLGNPAVWWSSSVSIIAGLLVLAAYIVMAQRKIANLQDEKYARFIYQLKITTGGWALHYLPFFLMGRVTYVHHYYPALLFAILNVALVFDHLTLSLSPRTKYAMLAVMLTAITANFAYFSPMCYGISHAASEFSGRQWLSSWNLV